MKKFSSREHDVCSSDWGTSERTFLWGIKRAKKSIMKLKELIARGGSRYF